MTHHRYNSVLKLRQRNRRSQTEIIRVESLRSPCYFRCWPKPSNVMVFDEPTNDLEQKRCCHWKSFQNELPAWNLSRPSFINRWRTWNFSNRHPQQSRRRMKNIHPSPINSQWPIHAGNNW